MLEPCLLQPCFHVAGYTITSKNWITTPTPSYIMFSNKSNKGVPSRFYYVL